MYGYVIAAPLVVVFDHPPEAHPIPPDAVKSLSEMYCVSLAGSYHVAAVPVCEANA